MRSDLVESMNGVAWALGDDFRELRFECAQVAPKPPQPHATSLTHPPQPAAEPPSLRDPHPNPLNPTLTPP